MQNKLQNSTSRLMPHPSGERLLLRVFFVTRRVCANQVDMYKIHMI